MATKKHPYDKVLAHRECPVCWGGVDFGNCYRCRGTGWVVNEPTPRIEAEWLGYDYDEFDGPMFRDASELSEYRVRAYEVMEIMTGEEATSGAINHEDSDSI